MDKHHKISPEESLGGLMGQAGKSMSRALMERFRTMGVDISLDQWIVLMHLWQEDGQNQVRLGDTAGHSKTTVTRAIDSLEKKSLVLRIPDQNDRRNKLIYLTHQGKEMQQSLLPSALRVHHEAVAGIPEEDLEVCKSVLRKVFLNLKHYI